MTQFDLIVSFIVLLFMTSGLFKGAIRSILGLAKWYGAGVLTLLFYPKVSAIVAGIMQPGIISNGVAVFLTYIVALIILSIIVGIFVAALGGTVGGPSDRIIGAIVGLTIGIIIASTIHYFIRSFSGGTEPNWLKEGKTYQITSQGADKLQNYFKDVVKNMGVDMGFVKDIDPTGALEGQIKNLETTTGSNIDLNKLKEAIKLMKQDGATPEQIRQMINIQDYVITPDTLGAANSIVNQGINAAKQIQGNLPKPPITPDGQE